MRVAVKIAVLFGINLLFPKIKGIINICSDFQLFILEWFVRGWGIKNIRTSFIIGWREQMPSLKPRRARQMSELKSRLKLSDATSCQFDRILTAALMYVRLALRENEDK